MTRLATFLVGAYLAIAWGIMAIVAALVMGALWLALRPLLGAPGSRAPRPAVVHASAKPEPFDQRDPGDETDVVPEGLGYPASQVQDGRLLDLGALHPNDQAVFGPARRPQ